MADVPESGRFDNGSIDDRQYRLLVNSVTDYAIYMLDLEGKIISWNPGAERFKGYTSAEAIGRNFAIFYTREDQARNEPRLALDTAMTEGRFGNEGWRVRKDGSRFWASVVVEPVREGRTIIGFAKITRDITERKEAEELLNQLNSTLLQAQKMEAIGQLAGGIAHDFNNVLAIIVGNLDLLHKRLPNDPKMARFLDNALEGARRGESLTHRMLAFARRQELKTVEVDLMALVRNMTTLMQRALGDAFSLETHLPPTVKSVLADQNQLEMALLNLTVNARDAMPDGGAIVIEVREAELGIELATRLAAGAYVCLSVKDSGVGMNEETRLRATQPFYTTKKAGQGTGLGLSMVHRMAIQVGGCFALRSEVGKGTTAELWLPLAEERAVANRLPLTH